MFKGNIEKGKLDLFGITLSKNMDLALWKDSEFSHFLRNLNIDDNDLEGVHLAHKDSYFGIVEDDVHYFAGNDTVIRRHNDIIRIKKFQTTLSINPMFPFPSSVLYISEDIENKYRDEIVFVKYDPFNSINSSSVTFLHNWNSKEILL